MILLLCTILVLASISMTHGDFQFPLPAPIHECIIQLISSLDEVSHEGLVVVVSHDGYALDIKCLHKILPESTDRPEFDRFELHPSHFVCEEGLGTVCNGSIGSVVIQSAFSRSSFQSLYSKEQYELQQWLKQRCNLYDEPDSSSCFSEYRKLRYSLPSLLPSESELWRSTMAEWLQLDENPLDVYMEKDSSIPSEQNDSHNDEVMSAEDVEFWKYIEDHPEEAETSFMDIVARFNPNLSVENPIGVA